MGCASIRPERGSFEDVSKEAPKLFLTAASGCPSMALLCCLPLAAATSHQTTSQATRSQATAPEGARRRQAGLSARAPPWPGPLVKIKVRGRPIV